jgi:cytochrome P450
MSKLINPIQTLPFIQKIRWVFDPIGYLEKSASQYPDLYPNSDQFKPERFLDRQFSPYEFMPFGGGARRCVGEALAQFEMKIILATILSHYNLKLREDQPVKPQRKVITLSPKGGIKIAVV